MIDSDMITIRKVSNGFIVEPYLGTGDSFSSDSIHIYNDIQDLFLFIEDWYNPQIINEVKNDN